MIFVAFSGKMGTGKTTIAEKLQKKLEVSNVYVLRLGFAACLKAEVAKKYKIALEDCYTVEGKQKSYIVSETGIPINKKCPGMSSLYIKPEWAEKGSFTVRELLQYYGTDVTRKNIPDYWVQALHKTILDWERALIKKEQKAKTKRHKFVIVDDMRFPNELQFINQQQEGFSIRIQPYLSWQAGKESKHQSETSLDTYKNFWRFYYPEYGKLDAVSNDIYNFFLKKLG